MHRESPSSNPVSSDALPTSNLPGLGGEARRGVTGKLESMQSLGFSGRVVRVRFAQHADSHCFPLQAFSAAMVFVLFSLLSRTRFASQYLNAVSGCVVNHISRSFWAVWGAQDLVLFVCYPGSAAGPQAYRSCTHRACPPHVRVTCSV